MLKGFQSIKNFFTDRSPWVFLTVGIRGAVSITIYKVVSLFFGPQGVTLFSHFQNFISLFTAIPDQGTNLGVMSLYGKESVRKKLFSQALIINSIIFLVLLLLILPWQEFFLRHFEFPAEYGWMMAFILISIFFLIFNSLSLSFIYATRSFTLLTVITLLNAVILVGGIYMGSQYGLFYTFLSFVIGWGVSSLLNISICMMKGLFQWGTLAIDSSVLKTLSGFMLIAASSLLFGKAVEFFVRDFAIEWFGEVQTGLWQAQVRLSENYRSAFLGTIGLVFYSRINQLKDQPNALKEYTQSSIKLSIFIVLGGLLMVYFFRYPLIQLLYSSDFSTSGDFIHWQLLSDAFGMPSYLLVYVMAAQQRFKDYLKIHLLSALFYILVLSFLAGIENEVSSIPKANFIRFLLFFFAMLIYTRRKGDI